jgi:hypothetical protein
MRVRAAADILVALLLAGPLQAMAMAALVVVAQARRSVTDPLPLAEKPRLPAPVLLRHPQAGTSRW